MPISIEQLEKWASPPSAAETERIRHTRQLIEDVLDRHLPGNQIKSAHALNSFNYEVYVQGSYANSTNIGGESDIDIVVQLNSIFSSDLAQLPPLERALHDQTHRNVNYKAFEFKDHVFTALKAAFGDTVEYADKCLKVKENTNRVHADVVPCFIHKVYKRYLSHDNETFIPGIKFINTGDGSLVINFPKVHLANCEAKNKDTASKFKAVIRIFKNLKHELIGQGKITAENAPSYYIENLIYNCSSPCFDGSLADCTIKTLQFLFDAMESARIAGFVCANEQDSLFSSDTWNITDAGKFITAAADYFIEESK